MGWRAAPPHPDIELGAICQIERRAQEPLVGRVVARGAHVGIRAVRLRAQALLQEERSRAQAPVSRRLVAAAGLESVAGAFHLVAEDDAASGSGLDAAQPVVDVVKQGDRIRRLWRGLGPVSDFVCFDDLRYEVRTAIQLGGTDVHEEIAMDARWRPHCARYRAPYEALRIGLPGEPGRRQRLGARGVIALEPGG